MGAKQSFSIAVSIYLPSKVAVASIDGLRALARRLGRDYVVAVSPGVTMPGPIV
jgi:hypothetical protein